MNPRLSLIMSQDDGILDLIGGGQLQGCHDHSPLDELASKLGLL